MVKTSDLPDITADEFYQLLRKKEISNKKITEKITLNARNIRCEIDSCVFNDMVTFNGCKNITLNFGNCTFERGIKILSGEFDEINFFQLTSEFLIISGGIFNSQVNIRVDKINNINLLGGDFLKALIISGETEKTFGKKRINTHIENLNINTENNTKLWTINIVNLNIDYIFLTSRINSKLSFTDLSVGNIFFDCLYNYGIISFNNIYSNGKLGVFDIYFSELNDCTFSNIDLLEFRVRINSSNVSKIKTYNINWFKVLVDNNIEPIKMRENYRQLKLAMKNQGDYIQALEFEKQEFNYHYKSLKWNKKDFVNKLILATNWTNNQGQDWLRAFGLFLGTTLIFYTLIKISIGHTTFDISNFWYDVGRFFSIMNPTHSTDIFDPDLKKVPKAFLLDSIFRIVSAYFIFQIIVAFRKFVNR